MPAIKSRARTPTPIDVSPVDIRKSDMDMVTLREESLPWRYAVISAAASGKRLIIATSRCPAKLLGIIEIASKKIPAPSKLIRVAPKTRANLYVPTPAIIVRMSWIDTSVTLGPKSAVSGEATIAKNSLFGESERFMPFEDMNVAISGLRSPKI